MDALNAVLKGPQFALADGGELRATLELHPNYKGTSRLLGKAFGTLRSLGAVNSEMVAGYNPLCIKSMKTGRPLTAATYQDGQWKVAAKGREQLLPGMTDASVEEALNQGS